MTPICGNIVGPPRSPAPFWCTYAWNQSTGAGGSDLLWQLLAWQALARDPFGEARSHPSGVNWNDNYLRPAAITNRDIAASALLIASTLALTAALDALEQRAALSLTETANAHGRPYRAAARGLFR